MLTQASMPNPLATAVTDAEVFGATPAGVLIPPEPLQPAPERRTDIVTRDWYLS